MTLALGIREGISSSEKLLLLVLANYADAKMICWPSQAALARDTLLTDRTIRSLLTSLEEKGLLKRKERFSKGRMTSDLIMLTMRAETISTQGASISGEGGNPRHLRAETISDEPISEPSIEPLARQAREDSNQDQEREEISSLMKSLASDLGGKLHARMADNSSRKPLRRNGRGDGRAVRR